MPAPDYPTLYDFETQIEAAFITAFAAASMTAYAQQDTSDKTAPYLNVQATVGGGKRSYFLKNGQSEANRLFEFTLEVQVVTNRTGASANTTHKTMRGKVRHLLERWLARNSGGSNINANLTYLQIEDFTRTGGNRGVSEGQTLDLTTEIYGGEFSVKFSAWPT